MRPAPVRRTSDQDVAQVRAAARSGAAAAARVDRLPRLQGGDLQGRRDPGQECGQERHQAGEESHRRVEARLGQPRHVRRPQGGDASEAPDGEQDPGCPSRHGQEEALDHELPDDPTSPGAERREDRQLVPPGRAAGQEQVGDVDAADEQHGPDRGQQEPESARQVRTDDPLAERHGCQGGALAGDRIVPLDPPGEQRQARAGRLERLVLPQARDAGEDEVVPAREMGVRKLQPQRHPGRRLARPREAGRHDAHNRERHAGSVDRASEDPGVPPEGRPPQGIAQDDVARGLGHELLRSEITTESEGHAEDAEEVRAHPGGRETHRTGARVEVEVQRVVDRDAVEDPLLLPVLEIGIGDRPAVPRGQVDRGRYDEVLHPGKGPGAKQDRLEDAEDDRRRADAEAEGQHSRSGESAVAQERSQRQTQVERQAAHRYSDRSAESVNAMRLGIQARTMLSGLQAAYLAH
jgi:hypothetical protein